MNSAPRIGLDVTQAVKRRGRGIARYIREVVNAMPPDGLDADLFIRGHRWLQRGLIDELAPGRRRRWLVNPARLGAADIDLFHSFGNHLPRSATCPLSFTVHDVRALDEPAGYEGKERLQRNIERATGIICLTRYGRGRLLHHYPDLERDNITVIPHGVDHRRFRPADEQQQEAVRQQLGLHKPFLLQLGSWFPHKNLELSIRAWLHSESRSAGRELVFVGGGAPDDYRDELKRLLADAGAAPQVHWIEHVGGAELAPLLSAADCLLQPSRYEGFALPLLEAMACGTPGVVSDSSCLPEVSAGIWPTAGVDDPDGFAAGIDRVVLDEAARGEAVDAGLAYAADFTWERTARANDRFFRHILGREPE